MQCWFCILAPAAVMAAGQQGQAQGIGNEAGNCLNVQHQIAGDTTAQEKFQNGQGQGSGNAMQNGDDRYAPEPFLRPGL